MKENREEYQNEKEKREKRLLAAGFFRSDTTIGGGKKETETNAAGIIGYNRCENIEYSKV